MNWSVPQDTEWEFILYIEGLDQVYPLPDPLFPPSMALAQHEIRVEVLVSEDVVASGSITVPPLEVEGGTNQYNVTTIFHSDEDFTSDDGTPRFRLDISVTGRGEEESSPLRLHYGSEDHASRLKAPSYPHDAFRAAELDYLLEQECQNLILQQKSCEDLKDERTGNETQEPDDEEPNETGTDISESTSDENMTDQPVRTSPGPGIAAAITGLTISLLLGASRYGPFTDTRTGYRGNRRRR